MFNLASLNSRFKIGTRINAGFLTVLALLLVVSAVGYFGLKRSGDELDHYAHTSDNSIKVTEVDRNLAYMRRNALVYVQNGDEQALKRVRDQGKAAREDIAAIRAATNARHTDRLELLQKLSGLVDQFSANFELSERRDEPARSENPRRACHDRRRRDEELR